MQTSKLQIDKCGRQEMETDYVKVWLTKVRFPEIYPVCSKNADEVTTITMSGLSYLDSSPHVGLLIKS